MLQDKAKAGMKLGHYCLTVKLGEGLFSETWLAEHVYLENKEICLKIFINEKYSQFLKKQNGLSVIKDTQNLPHIEDYEPTNSPPYLAQELVRGRSLRQLLREQKRFSVDISFHFLSKIIQALKKMHQQNMAHLDLRPEHVVVDDKENCKLLDYLLGRVTTFTISEYYKEYSGKEASMPKPLMRSLLYKPKMQRMGEELGIGADIFALGILLFEMVTGTYPSRNALFPSNLFPDLPRKVDFIYGQCCGRSETVFKNCDEILDAIQTKESAEQVASTLPGVRLLEENMAVVAVKTLTGDKHYVDGKNINVLSQNLDKIMSAQLRFLAFDFSGIDYLNSSAIGFFVNFSDRVQKISGATVMFEVDRKVVTILSALGLEKVIPIFENLEQATQELHRITSQQK